MRAPRPVQSRGTRVHEECPLNSGSRPLSSPPPPSTARMRDSRPLQEGGARWNATLALLWWEDGSVRAQGVGVTGGRVSEGGGGGEGAQHHKNGHTPETAQVHGESRLPRSVTALRSQQASLTPGRLSSRTGRSRTCSEDKRAARVARTAAAALGEVGGAAASMMKFKPNQTRTYDREGYKKRAACLCFKNEREDEILLVSSSRYPDQWIVPGGGMEPEEEPGGAAVREVYEEAGVKGKLGRLLGVFENQDRKHRTYVYVLTVTEVLEDWEDSVNIGRKREWFKVEDALKVLQCHKPVHAEYLEKLKGCSPTNGNSVVPPISDNTSLYVTSAQTSSLPSSVR